MLGSQITRGDVLRTQLAHLDLGDVGILWMPGELPPELVHGLPADFNTAPPEKYYDYPHLHAVGADYRLPGHLLALVEESTTLTVGLGETRWATTCRWTNTGWPVWTWSCREAPAARTSPRAG